ncbi:hypothetical protein [Aeromicrobium duanguangcaii]|uniref:hypothetical protein n=1 Tax=Aeromicrobium duanguangcaii TaxID=2968086 RepID=UPI0020179920|nr:hypothetical protein [Aeromicrobium duanguangcaii]MCL3838372.1 hypothetical protein [Aeromicrobium duanguangcaii]
MLTVLADENAPAEYTYGVAGLGEEVVIADDGGAAVIDTETGETVAAIEKPWAVDANGAEVPTAYTTDGKNLVQVVDHRKADIAYPVTADPKFYRCDAYTHQCVLFSKKETKNIAKQASAGTAARIFATAMCAYMGSVAGAAACVAVVSIVADSLKKTFRTAAKDGKCVEVHYLGFGGAPTRWKVKKC